jgi:uncharacterized protein YqhQ
VSVRSFFRLFTNLQMMPVLESGEETLVGGQAVVEGVMMRAPHSYCVAVRRPDGEIVTEELPLERMSEKHKIFKYPMFRGVGTLYQAMKLGGRALKFSAAHAIPEEQASPDKEKKEELPGWAFLGPLVFSLAFYILAYKFVPLYLATRLGKVYPVLAGQFASSVVGGIVRLGILLAILYGVSRLKDMRRIFEYHGAEHKVVFNFESGQPVNVENAQRYTTFHPRCGTSFLFVLFLLTIPVYALIPFTAFFAKLLTQIALIPVLIGLSYELIRFAAKRRGSMLAVITAPGLWMQRITTKPPSNDQASVAIRALEGAMDLEKSQGGQLVIA